MAAHPDDRVEKYIHGLKYQIDKIKSSQLGISDSQKEDLVKRLADVVKTEAADEVLNEIKDKIKDSEIKRTKFDLVQSQHKTTTSRFREELYSLSKRANLNLSIGIVVTVLGLTFARLIAANFVDLKLMANNANQIVTYTVNLSDKGKALIHAWKTGERNNITGALQEFTEQECTSS